MLLIGANALLIMGALAVQSGGGASLSTVKPADLPVYSEASPDSPVVKTLHQGDRVIVEMEISSGTSWCWIRESDQAKASGYVLCAQLDRPQPRDPKQWKSLSPLSSSEAGGASPAKNADAPGTKSKVRGNLRDPEFWADRFNFTDEQRRRSAELQQQSGLAACRVRLEQMFRANGISGGDSLMTALGSLYGSPSGIGRAALLGTELDRCGAKYGLFWKKFVDLMDSEQKARLASEPYYVFFLARTLSDPAVEFGSYVLFQMRK